MITPTTWKEHRQSLRLDLESLTNNFQPPSRFHSVQIPDQLVPQELAGYRWDGGIEARKVDIQQ